MAEKSIAEIVTAVGAAAQEQVAWMIHLGDALTIAARNFYEVGTDQAKGSSLRGINEIQHRVYGRIRALQCGDEWTMESFLEMMRDTSRHFRIELEVQGAIRSSLS